MTTTNRQIVLAARPAGLPTTSDFRVESQPIPTPQQGELRVRTLDLSVDPYMRGRMNDVASYADPVQLGEVMVGEAVAVVDESRHDRFAKGDLVSGMFGWQEYAITDGRGVRRLGPEIEPRTLALHLLGMPGMTAYFGLTDILAPQQGETILVSAASGAVGSVVGQLAKRAGCRVVGTAGSDAKVAYLTSELGFDAGINYRECGDLAQALREQCPGGIDTYFDNVGGPLTDAVIPLLNEGGRVAVCGQISQYNAEQLEQGPRWLWHLIVKRAKVQGFLVFDYFSRFKEALAVLQAALQAGELKYREQFAEGIEAAPQAFIGLLQGENFGKQLVRVSEK